MRRFLLDTNVTVRYLNRAAQGHETVRAAVETLIRSGDDLFVSPQVIREFWAVATRPVHVNGLGYTVEEAEESIGLLLKEFTLVDDESGIFADWLNLVIKHGVSGIKVHDANHAATARHHGITHVLTLNPKDFQRYTLSGLSVLTPSDVNP